MVLSVCTGIGSSMRFSMKLRPPIPLDIKREVRQRCGFGCVVCGLPIYEYEHMLEWAEVRRHVGDEITLLCRQHHGEKTNGLLPKADVVVANANPYNKRLGVSTNYMLHYSGDSVKCLMGSMNFSYVGIPDGYAFAPLVIDGAPIIQFRREQGNLFLSFSAFDDCNKLVLSIVDNEIVYDTSQWDAEWVGQSLTIREAHKKILIKLTFNPPGEIKIMRGRILRNGVELLLGGDYMFIANNSTFISSLKTENVPTGLVIGDHMPGFMAACSISGFPRHLFDRKISLQSLRSRLSEKRKRL